MQSKASVIPSRLFFLIIFFRRISYAVNLLHSSKAETAIIVTKEGKPIGIVTDTDILDKVVSRGENSDFVNLKSIMSSPIITISSSATVKQALDLMRKHKIKRLPVTLDKITDKTVMITIQG